jgi:O-antigen ligase
MSENIRKDKILRILRAFQVYYLAFVCFLAASGEPIPGSCLGIGHRLENLLVIPLVIALTLIALEKSINLKFTWREGLFAAFLLFAVLGLLYSPHPDVVRKGLVQVVTATVLYLLLLHAIRTGFDIKVFACAFIAGAVLTTILGIMNRYTLGAAGTPTWGHYNTFGSFLHMPIALTLAITVFYIRQWRVLAAVVPVLVFLLIGAYVSHSRGTWLGCAVIVILTGTLTGKRGLAVAGIIAVSGLIVLVARPPQAFKEHGLRGLVNMNDQALQQRRSAIWPAATELIREKPLLGYGLNTYREVYAARRGIEKPDYRSIEDESERVNAQQKYMHRLQGNVHPHNELLQAWTSMGIAGVFFYVAMFVTVLLTYIAQRRLKLETFPAAIGLGVFAWFVGHTVHGIFDCFFFFSHAFAAAAVMLALMIGVYYSASDNKKEAPFPAPPDIVE